MLRCSWETEDIESLQRASDEMNAQSGREVGAVTDRDLLPGVSSLRRSW
jgi:hypothetical protein